MIDIKQEISTYFSQKSICILWFWREGKSTLEFLTTFIGIDSKNITVHDNNEQEISWIKTQCWEHYLENLEQYDIIIKTAGMSLYKKELEPVLDKITTQTELFFNYFPHKTIMVTGTKGKSTTVSLLSKMFQLAWVDYNLVGNIWVPPLNLLTEETLPERAILECSSYQLDGITPNPTIWILTSLYHEHHVERHDWSETKYYMSKIRAVASANKKLIPHQIEDDYSILTYDLLHDTTGSTYMCGSRWAYTYRQWNFSINKNKVASQHAMKLKWLHNRYNACFALWVCHIIGIDIRYFKEAISSFAWLEHRLEDCWIHWWIRRVNDAISTTPQSTIAALYTLWEQVETLFLWGKDWWYDFSEMIALIGSMKIKNVVLFWESWKIIKEQLPKNINTFSTNLMKEAIDFAHKNTTHNRITLLSCASPSYWLWKNFEEKGTLFKKHAQAL